jgi:hypothetical protein
MASITTGPTGNTGPTGITGPTGPGVTLVAGNAANNVLLANGSLTTINGATAGTLTFNGTTLTTSGGISAANPSTISAVSISAGAVTGVTTLNASGLVTAIGGFTGPALNTINGVGINPLTTRVSATGGFTGPALNTINGVGVDPLTARVSATGGFTGPATNTINNLNIGATGGAITNTSTTSNQIGGVTLNNGLISGLFSSGNLGAHQFGTVIISNGVVSGLSTSNLTLRGGTGGATMTLCNSGNIGINNSSPTYPLDVQGALRCYSVTNDVMGLMSPAYGNYIHIGAWNQAGATSKNLVLNQFGGNVGIGCNAPARTLDVVGTGIISCNVATGASLEMLSLRNLSNVDNGILRLGFNVAAGVVASVDGIVNSVATTGALSFKTYSGTAYAEGLYIASNQRVGISCNNPQFTLDVNGGAAINGMGPGGQLSLTYTTTTCNTIFHQNGNSFYILIGTGNTSTYNGLRPFVIRNTTGYIGIGADVANYPLDVTGAIRAAPVGLTQPGVIISGVGTDNGLSKNVPTLRLSNTTSTSSWNFYGPDTGSTLYILNGSSVGVGLVNGGTSWFSSSDSRMKTIIDPVSNATAAFETITPVYYTLNNDTDKVRRVGVIAQEILPHFPEAVMTDANGMYGVQYSDLISPLIAAVKELSTRLSNVEAQLAATATTI